MLLEVWGDVAGRKWRHGQHEAQRQVLHDPDELGHRARLLHGLVRAAFKGPTSKGPRKLAQQGVALLGNKWKRDDEHHKSRELGQQQGCSMMCEEMQRTCQSHVQRAWEAVPARLASSTADGSVTSQTKATLLSSCCSAAAESKGAASANESVQADERSEIGC